MPWKACSVMEERLRFVGRLVEGEGMSEVCREFSISRKTGYKIFNRYKDQRLDARRLEDVRVPAKSVLKRIAAESYTWLNHGGLAGRIA